MVNCVIVKIEKYILGLLREHLNFATVIRTSFFPRKI